MRADARAADRPAVCAGAAVREPLQLAMPPLALAAAGMFVVAVCDDGVHVFDRASSREVQHIDYMHDDEFVALSGRLPVATDAAGRCIVLAAAGQVLRLEPIALEAQVRVQHALMHGRVCSVAFVAVCMQSSSCACHLPAHTNCSYRCPCPCPCRASAGARVAKAQAL